MHTKWHAESHYYELSSNTGEPQQTIMLASRTKNSRSSTPRKGASRKAVESRDKLVRVNRTVTTMVDNLKAPNMRFTRRITASGVIATNGSGFIPITTIASSASVSGLSDFTSLSGLYLEYRVKAMKATLMPIFKVNVAGLAPSPAMLVTAGFSSGLAATTFQQALDSYECQLHCGYNVVKAEASFEGFNDAQLWTPVTTAISASESYGIFVVDSGVAPPSQLSTTYYRLVTEYIVQFRSPA